MKLNLCVKEPNSWIDYHLTSQIVIEQPSVNFHPKIIVEEVMSLPKREKKKIKIAVKSFLMTATSFLTLTSKSMAEALNPSVVGNTSTAIPTAAVGLPPELLQLMLTLLVITVGIGIILSAILMASAGIMRMMGKKRRKEAEEWSVDIIKGFVQVLLAAPVIFLIYYIASAMLKGSGWFISPF